MEWQNYAAAVIQDVHNALPADADLKTRRAALRSAKPYDFRVTSWGNKVWAKHTRKYLEKHGLPPRKAKGIEDHLSPIERMIANSKQREVV